MKRATSFLLILLFFVTTAKAVSIQNIRAEDYFDVASRLVFDMDSSTDFIVQAKPDGFYIGIEGYDGKYPNPALASIMIMNVSPAQGGVFVKTIPNLKFEKLHLTNTKQLVVDLLTTQESKEGRMAIAKFYFEVGKLASADKAYHELFIDYRNHNDVLYHWGLLLLKRGSNRAYEKLSAIPPSSSFYASAQKHLKKPEKKKEPSKAEDMPLPEIAQASATVADSVPAIADTSLVKDSLIVTQTPQKSQVFSTPLWEDIIDLAANNIIYSILLFVATIVILSFLIFGNIPKKDRSKVKPDSSELECSLDSEALYRMVNRLIADGWKNKEIARELKIKISEVEIIVKRLHQSGFGDSDSSKDS